MQTTQEIAEYLGVTVQSVNRYIRKACNEEGIKVSSFGKPSAQDKRIRTFSEQEVALILKYAPSPKPETEQVLNAEIIENETTTTGEIVKVAQPLMGFGGIQNLTVNVVVSDTSELDRQTQDMKTMAVNGFNAIANMLTGEIKTELKTVQAENRNAIRMAQAIAVNNAATELGKPESGATGAST